MAVDSKHPRYIEFLEDWTKMWDTYRGERVVKEAGETYLPSTSGQKADGFQPGQQGYNAYAAYKKRASFPDVVKAAVEAMIGVMHHKPPVIELPAALENMRENATLQGESLEMMLRRINENQLIYGRLGCLLDVPDGAPVGETPYIALYNACAIYNWDNGARDELVSQNLNLVTLDESEYERKQDFEWEFENKTRVAILGDPMANEPKGVGVYRVGVFKDSTSVFTEEGLVTPSIGGRTLSKIPFVFINSKDIVPSPDQPPLLGLAQLALTIYRGEADYRQALFMQGQDTLVVTGSLDEDEIRTGANASIKLPIGGDAKFIGVESTGLTEMREALQNDKNEAREKGGQLLDTTSRAREAEGSLKIRVAARTATLNQIALAGAFGLEQLLRMAAEWVGANPAEVKVEPNLDFADDDMDGKTLVEYMTAKSLGAPYSLLSIHKQMRDRDLTEFEFEEELKQIEKENDMEFGMTSSDDIEATPDEVEGTDTNEPDQA